MRRACTHYGTVRVPYSRLWASYAVPYGTVLYGIVSGRQMDGGDGLATPLTGLAMDAHDRTRLDTLKHIFQRNAIEFPN